ncbi:MAG TPA: LytR C-terminal domain-containing protein [Myxococcales bacterium]|jgi:hypothetical protein
MNSRTPAAALASLALALAAAPAAADQEFQLKGFTAKGAEVVYVDAYDNGGAGGCAVGSTTGVVRAVKTGKETRFAYDARNECEESAANGPDEKAKKAFDAFVAAHPLTPAAKGAASPDRKRTLKLEIKGAKSAWHEDFWAYDEGASTLSGSVEVGGKRRKIFWAEAGAVGGHVYSYWSKEGDALVLVHTARQGGMMSPEETQLTVLSLDAPTVEVLAPKGARAALRKVVSALAQAGFTIAGEAPAKKERAASVVYAAKGQDAAAKAVAAAVPGGATVEPLTWASDADVVVAVGASAGK